MVQIHLQASAWLVIKIYFGKNLIYQEDLPIWFTSSKNPAQIKIFLTSNQFTEYV